GGTPSSSSKFGSTFDTTWDASKAFDGDTSTRWLSRSPAVLPEWLQFVFPTERTIVQYAIRGDSNAGASNASPTEWKFQGSNDGVDWTDLHSVTGQSWVANETKVFTL